MTPVERLLAKLPDAKQAVKGWSARCPAHEDRRASLSIGEGEDGRALVKCHAGCKPDAICAAVGLRVVDLMPTADTLPKPSKPRGNGKPRIVAQYDYRDEAGNVLFQAVRFDPKDFRQRRPKPGGGWEWSVKGVRVVPYRLPELLAEPARAVVVAEGEKDCDNLARMGVLATCNASGAGKWTAEHSAFLRGRRDERRTETAGRSRARLDTRRAAVAGNHFFRRDGPAQLSDARIARRAAAMGGSRVARHANAGGPGGAVGVVGLLRRNRPARGGGTSPRLARAREPVYGRAA
ncbi:MAG: hypothetical protein J5I93_25945 [Pirellulaceae bacterium]|nr:hypothetical protein [Pirellulaceae bacterium]